jgi:hypothetical protein
MEPVITLTPAGNASDPGQPIGMIMPIIEGSPLPEGWIVFDGRVVRREDYPQLFEVIGLRYTLWPETPFRQWLRRLLSLPGPADAYRPGEFRLPDLRGAHADIKVVPGA